MYFPTLCPPLFFALLLLTHLLVFLLLTLLFYSCLLFLSSTLPPIRFFSFVSSSPLFSSLLPTLLLSPFLCPSHFSLISFLLSSTLFPLLFFYPGANILTRSMITFGQGLNRAHPNLINIVNTLEKGDDLKGFTREVKLH